jgi:hypothetical protein
MPSSRARALVDRLWSSNDPTDIVRLEAQARLIAAHEERKWPRRPPSLADLIRHLMDQHGLTRADMVPILGTPSRVPRPGYEPPPPEWKSRDYLKDVLSKYDPHRKYEA